MSVMSEQPCYRINAALTEVHAQMQHQQEWTEHKLDKTQDEQGQRVDRLLHLMQEKTVVEFLFT